MLDEVRLTWVKLGQVRLGQVRLGQVMLSQSWLGLARIKLLYLIRSGRACFQCVQLSQVQKIYFDLSFVLLVNLFSILTFICLLQTWVVKIISLPPLSLSSHSLSAIYIYICVCVYVCVCLFVCPFLSQYMFLCPDMSLFLCRQSSKNQETDVFEASASLLPTFLCWMTFQSNPPKKASVTDLQTMQGKKLPGPGDVSATLHFLCNF